MRHLWASAKSAAWGASGALALALAALSLFAAAAPACAQSATAQLQAYSDWAGEYRRIAASIAGVLQGLPQPPSEEMDRPTKREWAAQARTWAESTNSVLATQRIDIERLPSTPPAAGAVVSAQVIDGVASSRSRLLEAVTATERIAAAHLQMADAFERNQGGRVQEFRTNSVEAALLMLRLYQDINTTQAEALDRTHPQRALLESFASSYEGLWAELHFKLGLLRGENPDRASAAEALGVIAQQMRAHAARGRQTYAAMLAMFASPRAEREVDPLLLPRLRTAFATYPAAFDREIALAREFEAIAALLRDPRPFVEVEPAIDAHAETIGRLDLERLADVEARVRLLTQP